LVLGARVRVSRDFAKFRNPYPPHKYRRGRLCDHLEFSIENSQRFLVARLSSLGDVVCSLPAASALKKGIPGAHVTWAVSPKFADVVRACSSVDEVVDPGGVSGKFVAALDLQGLLKSARVIARAKAETKVGYHWQREGSALVSRRVLPDPSSLHIVDQYVDVARAVGGEADRAEFGLVPDPSAVERMRALVGVDDFVVINPGAAWASKRWPPAHVAALIDALPIPVVLTGAAGDTSAAEAAAASKKDPIDLTGKTSISELIALISLARAHVGGDTGSTHIAAALGIPAIGLYSATSPTRSCPYGQIHRCHYQPDGLARIEPSVVLGSVMEAIG
jgi:heptosyltransferase-1